MVNCLKTQQCLKIQQLLKATILMSLSLVSRRDRRDSATGRVGEGESGRGIVQNERTRMQEKPKMQLLERTELTANSI